MKKVITLLLALTLCIGLVACGGDSGSEESEPPTTAKTVDAIAKAVGLEGEKEAKAYDMVEAQDGAGYGDYEIYIYDDTDSDAYQQITGDGYNLEGLAILTAAASNDGAVLIYGGDGEPDQAIIDAFNGLNLK